MEYCNEYNLIVDISILDVWGVWKIKLTPT